MVINVISLMYLINDADRYYSVSVAEKIRLNGCLIVSLKKKQHMEIIYEDPEPNDAFSWGKKFPK